jgi:epoxide hydrolase
VSDAVTPFQLAVPEAALADLRDRLRRTRWPEAETVDDWSQGVPLAHLQELCAYWADGYDWRATEARLNAVPQFRTVLDGLGVHFLHVRSPHPDALPLVLTHGWPGSVVEFLDAIPLLFRRTPRTRSTSCARRCRATGSATGLPTAAGPSSASPRRGRS